jgi:sulfate transport system permease protein
LTVLPYSEYVPHDEALIVTARARPKVRSRVAVRDDPAWVRLTIIALTVVFLGLFIVIPLVNVFAQAFAKGIAVYFAALTDAEALAAIRLTLIVAAASVLINGFFGLMAAWAIAKFEFRGKNFLITLIDLPFSVSPVIAGLVFVLLFGLQGLLGRGLPRTTSRSSSRFPASCWQRSSSHSRSSCAS